MSVKPRVATHDPAHEGWRALLVILACVGALLAYTPLWAQVDDAEDPAAEHVGVVIVTGDGIVQTHCVPLPQDAHDGFSGYDALTATGVRQKSEVSGMGVGVCSLDGVGCDYPRESCFCQCNGTPCNYWSYWKQDASATWRYSNRGASGAPIAADSMEGWVWGDGAADSAPPPLTLADVCTADGETVVYASAVTLAATPRAAEVAASVANASPREEVPQDATAVAAPPLVAGADDAPVTETGGSNLLLALGLLLIPLVLLLGAFLVMRRPGKPTS